MGSQYIVGHYRWYLYVSYLTCMCPQTSVNVTDVVKLVGGHFMHLCLAALKLRTGLNMELLKEYLVN